MEVTYTKNQMSNVRCQIQYRRYAPDTNYQISNIRWRWLKIQRTRAEISKWPTWEYSLFKVLFFKTDVICLLKTLFNLSWSSLMLRSVQRSFYGEVHPKHHLNLKTSEKLEIWKAYDNSNHLNLKTPENLKSGKHMTTQTTSTRKPLKKKLFKNNSKHLNLNTLKNMKIWKHQTSKATSTWKLPKKPWKLKDIWQLKLPSWQ